MTNKADDSKLFKEAVESLISHCQEIVNDVKVSHDNIISVESKSLLDDYTKVFRGSRPNKHYTFYQTLLSHHRVSVLSAGDDGSWMKNGISVKCSAKLNTIKLDISLFYNAALRHAGIVQHSLKDLPSMKHKGLTRPYDLRLALLKAFAHVVESDDDRNTLYQRISDLEKIVASTVSTPGTTSSAATMPTASSKPIDAAATAAASLGPLGGLFDMAATFAKNAGFQMPTAPPGVSGPAVPFDLSSIGDAFKKMTESGVLNNIVQNLVSEVSKAGILPPSGKRSPLDVGVPPIPPVAGTVTTGIVAEETVNVVSLPSTTTTMTSSEGEETAPPAPVIPTNNAD